MFVYENAASYVITVCGSCISMIVQVVCHDSCLLVLDLLVLL